MKDNIEEINVQRKAERNKKQLTESEEKYRNLINNLTEIILEIDLKGTVTYVSPQCYEIMGYHPTELIGKNALKYIHPKDVPIIAESMKKALQTQELISVPKYKLLHKNGDIIFCSALGKYVIINKTERFIVTIRDITARTIIEQKLKESEEINRLISENANDLISIFNEDFEVEFINKKPLLNILGYRSDELIGKNGLELIHPDDRKRMNKDFFKSNKKSDNSIEARVKHKLGHYIIIETNGNQFIDKDGNNKFFIISRDVTERKKAENVILEDNRKLMEISKIKSELVMRASHELKTPLSSIYGASQLLVKEFKDKFNPEMLKLIEIIHRGTQKLRHLIENLLDVSRVESGKLDLNLQDENLVEIINDCCDDLNQWAIRRNIKMKIEVPDEFIIKIDKTRIEQVIINLLSNAIKYTPPKGNIYISLNENDQWKEFSIKDTGIGLTQKELKSLFQKFGKIATTSKGVEIETEGSGLGLYISKEIVELHNGKLIVESEGKNMGSTFTVKLPRSN